MTFQLVLFSFDILEFSVTLVVLGLLWFADKRTPRVQSLLVVGVATCFWIIFDSVAMVARNEAYGYFYTLRSIMLVIDPYCLLWFVLSMNESRLLKSRMFNRALFILPAADVVLLLTDPFHHLVFTSHGFPLPEYGPFFAVHSIIAYIAVLVAIVYIFRFMIRYRPPVWFSLLAGLFSLMPVVVNVLFTLHLLEMSQDIAPTAFFVLFLLFAIHAFRARLINFKAIALTEIFELFQDSIIFVEKDFIIIDSNRAMRKNFAEFTINPGITSLGDLTGYLRLRCTNKSPEDLFDRMDLSSGRPGGHAPESAPQGLLGEFTMHADSGAEQTFTVSLLRVYRFNKLYGYSITLSDVSSYRAMITEMTELKEMAESASRAKSTFLANMSHEIRTPLNAIIGLGELELRKNLDQETRANLGKMQNSAQILLSIINDLLDISKIESGRFELIPVEYSLPDLVSGVVNINFVRIGSKPITVVLKVDENLPGRLFGDELRVRQLFSNILSNAFKYTQEGKVEMSLSYERLPGLDGTVPEGGREQILLVCAVKDTGIGIKRENISSLFTDYYQVDGKSNRLIEGTGLGLAISKRFALMMGGDIQVESEYGKGSIFTVRIRQEAAGPPIGAETAASLGELRFIYGKDTGGSGSGAYQGPTFLLPGTRILIVDDVEINLEVAKGMLEPYEAVIDCVESGQAAIDLIRDGIQDDGRPGIKYDIIFMDHMMPGLDGIETVRVIRNELGASSQYAREVPIIALTANAIIGNEAMFLEHGFQAMLSKPMEIDKLEAILKQYIS